MTNLKVKSRIDNRAKKFRQTNQPPVAVMHILDGLNLQLFWDFLSSRNTSNGLPYHNKYHALCMLLNCYEGGISCALTIDGLRGLCAAALLHDFGHSGGRMGDDVNIGIALEGLDKAQLDAKSRGEGLSDEQMAIARSCISITQYPYVSAPKSTPEMIIRDADLMQLYEDSPEALLNQYLGLKKEIEVSKDYIPMKVFVVGLKKFHDEMVWHTAWAKERAKAQNLTERRENLYRLLSQHVKEMA